MKIDLHCLCLHARSASRKQISSDRYIFSLVLHPHLHTYKNIYNESEKGKSWLVRGVKSTMKTNIPPAICLIGYSFECMRGFCLIHVSFEGLSETSEEGLKLKLTAFETLYRGQFEISTQLIKRKTLYIYIYIYIYISLYLPPTKHHISFWKLTPLYFNTQFS